MFQSGVMDSLKLHNCEMFIKLPKGNYFDQSNQQHVTKRLAELWW